jgi:hypothetical protein
MAMFSGFRREIWTYLMRKEIAASLRPSADVEFEAKRTRNMGANVRAKAGTEQGSGDKFTIRLCISDKN